MKLQLTKKDLPNGAGAIYEAQILSTKVTLSKALVAKLKEEGKLKKTVEADDTWIITGMAKERNGKTYVNLYLTIPKSKTTQAQDGDGDLPF